MMTRRSMLAVGTGAAALGLGAYGAVSTSGDGYDDAVKSTWRPLTANGGNDLNYLVHYATLAANSHNAQPWLFARSQTGVTVEPDTKRRLPAADPDDHHLYASLGCAAENLMLAASAAGLGAASSFSSAQDGRVEIDLAGTSSDRDPLFDAILERQCTRSDYDGRAVTKNDLDAIAGAAKVEGCEIILIPDQDKIGQALEMIISANTIQVENLEFTAELKSWIRFSSIGAAATRDGLFAACSGNPTMPAWLGNLMFGFVFKAPAENDKISRQMRSSSGLAVFVTDKDDKEYWIKAGRSYQRFALKSTMLGVRHAFLNQPVEVASIRSEFSKWLGVNGRRPDLVVRYGYAPPMPKSLRRPVQDVLSA
jgi:hypothetical protein